MTQVRVNIRTAVNASAIRRERRSGRDVIIVPSATLPDNIVMNRIRYPADEIAKSFETLEGTPAPLGHPNLDGAFLSASHPLGMVRGFIGAWNENVRRENGRVFMDKVIDVEYASQLTGGQSVLNAIEKGDPIHTSTGLYAIMTPVQNDSEADRVASDIFFDHDAILLGEAGAATPEQGVGMLVNAKGGESERVEVVNSLYEDMERELDWSIDSALRAAERLERMPLLERIKRVILDAVRGGPSDPDTVTNTEKEQMAVTDEQFQELANSVKALTESIPQTIANAVAEAVKPVQEQAEAATNALKARDAAELAAARAAVVNANLMDEEAAAELTLNAALSLVEHAKPKHAYALNGAFGGNGKPAEYDLPE